jgi:hypothetical protein
MAEFITCLQNYRYIVYGLLYEVAWNILSDVKRDNKKYVNIKIIYFFFSGYM